MKIKVRHLLWLLFLSIILITTAQAAFADVLAVEGEKYTVVKGDTLWDISALKLENPFSWKQIWKQNSWIKNPDLIYPGETITLPPGAVLKKTGEAAKAEIPADTGESAPFVERGKTIIKATESGGKVVSLDTGPAPKLAIATDTQIMSAGFIGVEFNGLKNIAGDGLDARDIYSEGDKLYIEPEGVSEGDVFLIGRIMYKVDDPASGGELGRIFYPSGSFKVTGEIDGKMAGNVVNSFTAINADDVLLPYELPPLTYEPVPSNDALKGMFGYVAEVKDEKNTGSSNDIIYLDMGSEMGVKPGDRFVIRRSGDKDVLTVGKGYASPDEYVLPDNVAGEVQVISVQPLTSTAKVVEFKEIIRRGYRAVYKD